MKSISTAMTGYRTGARPSAFASAATSSTWSAIVEVRRERAHAPISVPGTGELCPQSGATGAGVRDAFPTPFPGTTVWSVAPA
jgi:hypothetical protein